MKKLSIIMGVAFTVLAVGLTVLLGATTVQTIEAIDTIKKEQQEAIIKADSYTYVISEINGDEVNGLAITKKSNDNSGIVLSKSIDNVDVVVGDIIEVTYGEAFDNIVEVKIVE